MVQVITDVPLTHVYMCVCCLCYERVVESGCIWVEVFFCSEDLWLQYVGVFSVYL